MSIVADIVRWPRADYEAWVALGEGGVRHGTAGWMTVTALRGVAQLGRAFPLLPPAGRSPGFLPDLPRRAGTRPRIAPHPIPQREICGACSQPMLRRLEEMIVALRDARQDAIDIAPSKAEKHADALYVPCAMHQGRSKTGEMVHIHHPQGSLHVHLSSNDARLVYERGWGEPHTLSFLVFAVPKTWFYLYYPRDADEFKIVETIATASLDWACGSSSPPTHPHGAGDTKDR